MNEPVKKEQIRFADYTHGVSLIAEKNLDPNKPYTLPLFTKENAYVQKILMDCQAKMHNVYCLLRKKGFSQIDSITRIRAMMLGLCEVELNGGSTEELFEKYLNPYEQPIPTDPNFQTEEQKAELAKRKANGVDHQAVS